ncbi:hypothetical protein G6F66_014176 [Rhizopus arrhizus]|nr:hypothetical protein G6F66_014176 [Rhizopus arrhizus]
MLPRSVVGTSSIAPPRDTAATDTTDQRKCTGAIPAAAAVAVPEDQQGRSRPAHDTERRIALTVYGHIALVLQIANCRNDVDCDIAPTVAIFQKVGIPRNSPGTDQHVPETVIPGID